MVNFFKPHITRHRASLIVVHGDQLLGFYADDPTTHRRYFFLPGGKIEANESPETTALRECREETGYEVFLETGLRTSRTYEFEWDKKIHVCETQFLSARLKSTNAAQVSDASYHRGVAWIHVSEIPKMFAYHEAIRSAVCEMVGDFLLSESGVSYYLNRKLQISEVIEVYRDSGLKRPIEDAERIAEMYSKSNLIVSAYENNRLVGVSRSLSDFSYCTYLSDLAVLKSHQNRGVGSKLIDLSKQAAGPRSNLVLLSAPDAMEYYPKLGFNLSKNAFIKKRDL